MLPLADVLAEWNQLARRLAEKPRQRQPQIVTLLS